MRHKQWEKARKISARYPLDYCECVVIRTIIHSLLHNTPDAKAAPPKKGGHRGAVDAEIQEITTGKKAILDRTAPVAGTGIYVAERAIGAFAVTCQNKLQG